MTTVVSAVCFSLDRVFSYTAAPQHVLAHTQTGLSRNPARFFELTFELVATSQPPVSTTLPQRMEPMHDKITANRVYPFTPDPKGAVHCTIKAEAAGGLQQK